MDTTNTNFVVTTWYVCGLESCLCYDLPDCNVQQCTENNAIDIVVAYHPAVDCHVITATDIQQWGATKQDHIPVDFSLYGRSDETYHASFSNWRGDSIQQSGGSNIKNRNQKVLRTSQQNVLHWMVVQMSNNA